MPKPELKVKIQSRETVLYDDYAYAVSSENDTGKFSILAYHANFITLLKNFVAVKDSQGVEKRFPVDNGVLRVEKNFVEVFLGVKIGQ